MVADGPRETVSQIVCVVHLSDGERIRSYRKVIEEHLFNASLLREALDDTLAARQNALIGKRDPDSALGCANVVVKTSDAEPGLIDGIRAEGMNVAEDDALIYAYRSCIVSKAVGGESGSPEAAGIRIVEVVAVVEVVDRGCPESIGVEVETATELVVIDAAFISTGREGSIRDVARGNVLQHALRRGAPRTHGYDRFWKDALTRSCAAVCIEGFVQPDLIAEALAQYLRKVRSVYRTGEAVCGIREIPDAIRIRGNADGAGLNALDEVLALIVAEEEDLVLTNRSTDGATVLVLMEGRTLRGEVVPCVQMRVAKELEDISMWSHPQCLPTGQASGQV
jgi:hypothetical protein